MKTQQDAGVTQTDLLESSRLPLCPTNLIELFPAAATLAHVTAVASSRMGGQHEEGMALSTPKARQKHHCSWLTMDNPQMFAWCSSIA
eukprot:CAMPEP_0181079872 /NCGR_PEP_ID=MMETSP1071-20121207/2260_1 /TAXON_ID=35127 /ORGANISM="Thalassiosira sp., Strain NH16" /LENGTH=87 /DNA_ID=CAMNT_0023161301 /DNA_START=563 /DNA_END=826 /DNA_ORIENTATION=+